MLHLGKIRPDRWSSQKGFRTAWVAASCALTMGCTVGPDFSPPAAPSAQSLTTQTPAPVDATSAVPEGGTQSFAPGADIAEQWWTLFRSQALDSLIRQALENSPDLKSADAALRAAMEGVQAQIGAYYPSITGGANASRNQNAGQLSPALSSPMLLFNLYQAQLGMSWSLDVWGLNRRQVEAARAEADAARYQLEQTYVALTSSVVLAAVQEASLRDQIETTRDLLSAARELLSIAERQYAQGAISGADVEAQRVLVAQVEQTLPPLEKTLQQQRDLLTALAGRLPADEVAQTFRLDGFTLPRELPLSLPSQIVEQRADIKFAEANMHAASAQIGVAIANMLPNFTITASNGVVATTAGALFSPGNSFWSIGGGVMQPIFDGGTLLHRTRAARAVFDQSTAQYEKTVLTAFQNIADVLHSVEADGRLLTTAEAAERAAEKSYAIARKQLELGQIGRSGLLTAQQAYLQTRLALSQARVTRLADTAALFQALGGGWWNRPRGVNASASAAPAPSP